MTVLPMLIQRM